MLRQARCPLRAAARQAGISPATPVVRTLLCTRDTGRFTVGPALLNAPGDAHSELWEAGVSEVARRGIRDFPFRRAVRGGPGVFRQMRRRRQRGGAAAL